jgi:hypothetical protein
MKHMDGHLDFALICSFNARVEITNKKRGIKLKIFKILNIIYVPKLVPTKNASEVHLVVLN